MIGKSLGHKSPAATAIYARVDLDAVRQSVQNATTAMLLVSGKTTAQLVAGKPKKSKKAKSTARVHVAPRLKAARASR